jgi:DNA polymerase III delta prime subunit
VEALGTDEELEGGVFEVADELEIRHGTEWVQARIAATVKESSLRPTPQLQALVRLPSRIIATTNYDDAIEIAARSVGLKPKRFLVAQMNDALQGPEFGEIHVLHLHGSAHEPTSIVLTGRSYKKAKNDQALRYGLQVLCVQKNLVFLGFSLAEREKHLWRDLLWSAGLFPGSGPHFLVMPQSQTAAKRFEKLDEETRIEAISYSEPENSHETVRRVIQLLGGASAAAMADQMPVIPNDQIDRWFVPMAMAPAEDVETAEERETWELLGAHATSLELEDLERIPRLLLIGPPGSGKTQTLYQLGRTSDQPTIYRRLNGMSPAGGKGEAGLAFVAWLESGESLSTGTLRPNVTSMGSESYLFLLDGLDEVDVEERDRVLETLGWVAEEFPQHRFVIATRRPPRTNLAIGFDAVELIPTESWMYRYFEERTLTRDQFEPLFDQVPALRELLKTPLYAATAADLLVEEAPLPESSLAFVMSFADRGFTADEPKLGLDPDKVKRWLDDTALAMELMNTVSVPIDELPKEGLQGEISSNPDAVVEAVILRTLLAESGSEIRFPANVVQEGRAASAVLHRDGGLELLRRFVLFEISGERGIRQSWSHTIELILSEAPDSWRDELREFDPLVVALTIPIRASRNARHEAVRAIWSWFVETRIFMPRDRPGGRLLNEVAVVGRLLHDGPPEGFIDELVTALSSPENTARANAIALLVELGEENLLASHLGQLLVDSSPFVRRRAGSAVRRLRMQDLYEVVRGQLMTGTG